MSVSHTGCVRPLPAIGPPQGQSEIENGGLPSCNSRLHAKALPLNVSQNVEGECGEIADERMWSPQSDPRPVVESLKDANRSPLSDQALPQ